MQIKISLMVLEIWLFDFGNDLEKFRNSLKGAYIYPVRIKYALRIMKGSSFINPCNAYALETKCCCYI